MSAKTLSPVSVFVLVLALVSSVTAALPASGSSTTSSCPEEPIDRAAVTAIRQEAFERSRVMETARALSVEIGPRLTGSSALARAHRWARDRLTGWGLENARLEAWGPFGRGWSFDRVAIHLVEPVGEPLMGLPEAWTPGTDGPVRGEVMRATIHGEGDLERYRGRVEGKVLLLDEPREPQARTEPALELYDESELAELRQLEIPGAGGGPGSAAWRAHFRKLYELRGKINDFCEEEGVVATVESSPKGDGLILLGGGGSKWPDESVGVPAVALAAEHYNRLIRLLELAEGSPEKGAPVLEIDVSARFEDDDLTAYNTVAEIPGTDLADQVVMVGAHLDTWHSSPGASDNAAGVAVAMEALRILRAAGLRPRRTVRIGLWSGEEQGLQGSRAYVREHFGGQPLPESQEERKMPPFMWRQDRGPLELEPEHARFSAYFNLDHGGGKIRGIHTQGNVAVAPIFEAWLEPLHDLGATTVSTDDAVASDYLAFDEVGLPGFHFIQDPRDYDSTTRHTHVDTFDHLDRDSLVQASVVLATFLHHAANRDGLLPRKPLPRTGERDEEEGEDGAD